MGSVIGKDGNVVDWTELDTLEFVETLKMDAGIVGFTDNITVENSPIGIGISGRVQLQDKHIEFSVLKHCDAPDTVFVGISVHPYDGWNNEIARSKLTLSYECGVQLIKTLKWMFADIEKATKDY